jgi:hypothetical protein
MAILPGRVTKPRSFVKLGSNPEQLVQLELAASRRGSHEERARQEVQSFRNDPAKKPLP